MSSQSESVQLKDNTDLQIQRIIEKHEKKMETHGLEEPRKRHRLSGMEEESQRERSRVQLVKQIAAILKQGDMRYTKDGLHRTFQDDDLLERIFRLFCDEEHLVQEEWIESLKERLQEDKQLDFVEQVESVAYVLCGDGVVTKETFSKIWKNKVVGGATSVEDKEYLHILLYITHIFPGSVRSSKSDYRISGILDFGDIQHSCVLFELSVCMTYAMLVSGPRAGGVVLAGWSVTRRLTDQEYRLLKPLVSARLVQSLVLGAYTREQEPENKYVSSTEKANGWELLKKIRKNKPDPEDDCTNWKDIANDFLTRS
ncbi:unnamed protein product [Danaus chrysippus]|uniref:(African queen) hypothetical protein n=1 Tax=Danaus chrysippus TaxID=151541 RepID=A0A8J2QSK7_9NEOP|nr:unnamed protein product [Danaus chrysippus]